MSTIKQQNKILWVILFVMLLLIGLGLTVFVAPRYYNNNNEKVCINVNEYRKLYNNKKTQENRQESPTRIRVIDDTRDRKVLNDPLYPALNRSATDVHNSVVEQIEKKNLYNTTQEFTDRYRLVAYVTNQDTTNKDVNLFFCLCFLWKNIITTYFS